MAPRRCSSTLLPVFSQTPIWRASSRPEMPLLEWETSQIARNHLVSGSLLFCVAVPAVRDSWCPHLVHCTTCLLVDMSVHLPLPHLGQTHPSGRAPSNRARSHASSVGNLAAHSSSVPSSPFSPRICLADMLAIAASLRPPPV